MKPRATVLTCFTLFTLAAGAQASSLPRWASEAQERGIPQWAAGEPATLVYDEQIVAVPAHGRVVVTQRGGLRVQNVFGEKRAVASAHVTRGATTVRSARGWLVGKDGIVHALGKDCVITVSRIPDYSLYSEWQQVLVRPESAPPGSTFYWEIVTEEEPLLAAWRHRYSGDLSVLDSRFTLTLPPGLEPSVRLSHPDRIAVTRAERSWTWRASDMTAQRDEPMAVRPAVSTISAFVSIQAPEGSKTSAGLVLHTWPGISRWAYELSRGQDELTSGLSTRASALAPAPMDTLAAMRAIAQSVARMNYVSNDVGISRGWGMRPHTASDVMRMGFGDCKDKANLMRALLQSLGFQAWLVPVHSEGAAAVDTTLPTPSAFDHCIVAVRVPLGTQLPAALMHPTLGRLIVFDATDPTTPFGELPASLQGAPAMLEAPGGEGLITLPFAPPGHDATREYFDATLDASGSLGCRLHLQLTGADANALRRWIRSSEPADLQRRLEARFSAGSGSATLTAVESLDDSTANRIEVRAILRLPTHARILEGGLLAFRTALGESEGLIDLSAERHQPVLLPRRALHDECVFRIPAGMDVDELPESTTVSRPCGEVQTQWRVEGGQVHVTRDLRLDGSRLPVERIVEYRDILRAWRASERALVVLKRP